VDAVPPGLVVRLPVTRDALELPRTSELQAAPDDDGYAPGLLYEEVDVTGPGLRGPLRVEYTLDAELTGRVFRTLRRARAALGHVIVMDPESGRLFAYASTDVSRFPPTRPYPAASLVKVITAAAALDRDPETARLPCRFRGNPWRLTPSRLDPPAHGSEVSLRRALATSNNQCFAQLAVHAVGADALLNTIARFGWLAEPAPAHDAGRADPGDDRFGLGRLGCGLAGCRITPLHAAQLAASLARGELVAPRWIHRVVDADGRELRLPAPPPHRDVMRPDLAAELRGMLVGTTISGTARHAFRKRSGQPLLGKVRTAGKTGSLSGSNPDGRYEWFVGVAPAERPRIAVAVLMVQGHLWWRSASQVAASVLESVFCEDGKCSADHAERWRHPRLRREEETLPAQTARAPGTRPRFN
jgi:cell division protein FtsI/penicillin-binding protein 2